MALRRLFCIAALLLTSTALGAQPRQVTVGGIDLTGVGYDEGSPTAPIVVVNFSDFGCPYCASFSAESYPVLAREFVQAGKVFYKYVPFAMGMFPNGKQAARASECAADQRRFDPMAARLYARQRDWKRARTARPIFMEEAAAAGLDTAAFAVCYDSRRTDVRTERATIIAERLGLRATPTFFVNGRGIEGALPLAQFQDLLRTLLRSSR
jgi:protein-disulfide isomerase